MSDPNTATAVDIDIVERVRDEDYAQIKRIGVVKPNTIRLNGRSVLVPADSAIEVSCTPKTGAPVVRLSLFVSSLNIGFEATGPLTDEEKTDRADLLEQIRDGRQLTIERDKGLPLTEPAPLWEGRAYDLDDLLRLRDQVQALINDRIATGAHPQGYL